MSSSTPSRVLIVQDQSDRFDISGAHRFGEVEFLLDPDISPFNTDRVAMQIAKRLRELDYDPDRDFIALTGPALMLALFMGIVMSAYTEPRILLFDAKARKYELRTLTSPFDLAGDLNG